MRLPDLEAWAIFARVAEANSFAGAAAELGIATATVSKAISRLEARVGAALLTRSSRRVALTAIGRELAGTAAAMLADAEALEGNASAQGSEPRGVVRIAAPMSFGVNYVAPLLPELLARHPALAVEISFSDEVVDLIASGFDFAIRASPRASNSMRVRRICTVPVRAVASPGWIAAHGPIAHPSELRPEWLFGYLYSPTPNRVVFRNSATAEEVSVASTGRLRVNNGEAMLPSLEAGAGLAVLPEFMVWEALRRGALVSILTEWCTAEVALNVVTPPGGPRASRVTLTMEFLVERLARAPWAKEGQGSALDPPSGSRPLDPLDLNNRF